MRHEPRPRVCILVSADLGSRREMLRGVSRYLHELDPWDVTVITEAKPFEQMVPMMRTMDGVIAARVEEDEHDLLGDLPCPVIALGYAKPRLAALLVDQQSIGQMAADYFYSLGLRQIAFCGHPDADFSIARCQAAGTRAAELHMRFTAYPRPVYGLMEQHPHELAAFHRFLRQLPRPVGLLAATSDHAHVALHHCRLLEIKIPGDIALLGVGADDYLTTMARPHLSYIDEAGDTMGYEACRLLANLMAGAPRPPHPTIIPPRGVVSRESTDLLYFDAPAVSDALRLIRTQALMGITVEEVCRKTAVGRRTLERAFRSLLQRSPHDEIVRIRLQRASQLLLGTTLSLAHVAQQSGFSSAAKLCEAFRSRYGTTPRHYRMTGGARAGDALSGTALPRQRSGTAS